MMPESRNSSLLDNGSVNIFPWKQTHATTEEAVFSMGATPRLCNKDLTQLEWENRIRCSKGTPIIKKSNPSLLSKEKQRKKKKTKVLTLNKYMAMGPSGARCQEWPCWLVVSSKLLLCSALLWNENWRVSLELAVGRTEMKWKEIN
jgi:hypothetical protein